MMERPDARRIIVVAGTTGWSSLRLRRAASRGYQQSSIGDCEITKISIKSNSYDVLQAVSHLPAHPHHVSPDFLSGF
jgi:hypothetical protein